MEGSRVEEDKPAGAKTSGSSSRYRGVGWHKAGKKWTVQIRVDGKSKHIGSFSDEIVAARAYDAFVIAKKHNKPLNFPSVAAAKGHVVRSSKTSRFRGVCWVKSKKKWVVQIKVGGKKKHIGIFPDEIEAANAYDAYVITNGINTPHNFLDNDEDDVVNEAAPGCAAKKSKIATSKSLSFACSQLERALPR